MDDEPEPYDDLLGADLEEWIAGDAGVSAEDDTPPPDPKSEEQVARLTRVLRYLDREEQSIKRRAEAEIKPIREWMDDRTAGVRRRRRWVERALEGWMRASNASTKVFPSARLSLRPPRARIEIVDDDALVTWAQENNRLDLLKLTASKDAIGRAAVVADQFEAEWADAGETARRLVTEDQEFIPGVLSVIARHKTFSAKPL